MPVVISIQGILSACIRVYFDDINWKEILLSPRIIQHYMMMSRKTKTERKIFRINRYFIGRTLWDKSHLMSLASGNFMYYLCHEVMRKEFYQQEWTINTSEPWTIACISSPYAYKGVNSILDAIGYLRKKIPRVMLYIYGSFFQNGYGAFLRNKVKKSRLMNNVQFCGFENSKELARRLRNVRAYVIASHVENGSNSLQEAMLVGTPSVVSFAGGMPSIAEHEKSCLMFPRGDSAVMAECLYKVLNDEKLAVRISKAARIKARKINNPERIAKRLLQIYKDVIARRGKNR